MGERRAQAAGAASSSGGAGGARTRILAPQPGQVLLEHRYKQHLRVTAKPLL
jgi:hypothetical protein